jgi:hypothetical protein
MKQKKVLENPYARTMKKKLRADVIELAEKIVNIQSIEWAPMVQPWKELEIEYYKKLIDVAKHGLKQLQGK